MTVPQIRTARMRLVPAMFELADVELHDRDRLSALLGAAVPETWPPGILRDAGEYFLNLYRAHPEWIGWLNWYGIRTDLSKQVLCGSVGFLGPPGEDGKIDIGYSVLPEHQRCGIATEMVAAVVDWAFASKQVRSIDAQTEVENRASIRVLVANGFRETGPGGEPGTIRYRREPAPDAVR